MTNLASNLILLRKEAHLSLEELSEKTGINIKLLDAFEKDQIEPNEYQLEIICKYLKMPADEIAERDLATERKEATKEMKKGKTRQNYNWYFGNKKHLIFYLAYIAYFVVATTILTLYYTHYFEGLTLDILKEYHYLYNPGMPFIFYVPLFFWANMRWGLIIYGLGVSFFILFEYFSSHRIVIRWWYIFWISLFVSLTIALGLIGSIPYLIIVIIKIAKKQY